MKATIIAKVKIEDSSDDKDVTIPTEIQAKQAFINNLKDRLSSRGKVEVLEFEMKVEE